MPIGTTILDRQPENSFPTLKSHGLASPIRERMAQMKNLRLSCAWSFSVLALWSSVSLCQQSWSSQTSGTTNNLYAVSFADANTGTAVGAGGTILRKTNGGTIWMNQVNPGSGTSTQYWGVDFVDAANGMAVADNGTIVRTTNGGLDWVNEISGTIGNLYAVSIHDASTATAVGQAGTVARGSNAGEYTPDANTVLLLHMNEPSGGVVSDASMFGNGGTAIGTTIVDHCCPTTS